MPAMETVAGFTTAAGAAEPGVALTMSAGNSLTIRSFNDPAKAHLITAFVQRSVTGRFRVRSARMHDQVQGIRMRSVAAVQSPLLTMGRGKDNTLESQDTLLADLTGSAVAGAIETGHLHFYYEDLPGVNARLIDNTALKLRAGQISGVEVALNPGAGGGWTGQRVLTFSFDNLKANKDYALLGCTVDVACGAVRIQGSDTGNLGIAIPGDTTNPYLTSNWFPWMSEIHGVPMIPIFNMANKNSILVDCTQNNGAAAVTPTLYFQELN